MRDAGLVLAAGAGRRFGGPKAPYALSGERLVDRAVRLLREGGCAPVVVVLGAWVGEVPGASVAVNEAWDEGMGSSLRAGLDALEALPDAPDRAVLLLVDLPGMSAAAVRRVREDDAGLVQATFGGRRGHPVILGRAHWPGVRAVALGDRGARDYLAAHDVTYVEVGHLADGATDLDVRPTEQPG